MTIFEKINEVSADTDAVRKAWDSKEIYIEKHLHDEKNVDQPKSDGIRPEALVLINKWIKHFKCYGLEFPMTPQKLFENIVYTEGFIRFLNSQDKPR